MRMTDMIRHGARCILFLILTLFALGPAQADTLTITTIERKPFAFQEGDAWEGFSIDLWRAVAEKLEVETAITPVDQFTDLLTNVETAVADVAVANVSITFAREQIMDFSHPIFDSGLIVLKPVTESGSRYSAIWQRTLLLWLVGTAAALALYEGIIWLLRWRRTNAGDTATARPITWLGSALGLAMVAIVGLFVAELMASLTTRDNAAQVRSMDDLLGREIGTTRGSTSAEFLTAEAIPFEAFDTIEALFQSIEAGDIDVIVHDAPILAYFSQTRGKGKFETTGRVFLPEKYGFALPSGHPRTEEINQALLQLREDGTYQSLQDKWFGETYP